MTRAWSRGYHRDIERSPVASVSKVQAHLRDAARFRARSTSHAVAAHSSCTKIPLSAGRAQGRREPFSKAAFQAIEPRCAYALPAEFSERILRGPSYGGPRVRILVPPA